MLGLKDLFFRNKISRTAIILLYGLILSVFMLELMLSRFPPPSNKNYLVVLPYLEHDRIGFWMDLDVEPAHAQYWYAQYGLAPTILNYSEPECCEQLLISLTGATTLPTFPGYVITHEFGDGIYLLERP